MPPVEHSLSVGASPFPATPSRDLVNRVSTRSSGAPLRHGNRLTLLRDGPDTYADWLAAISQAQRWVHLENYIFRADKIGHEFAAALTERAKAGVSVRVLYDWYGCFDVPRSFWRKLRQDGVDVRVANPPTCHAPFSILQRDHRKVVTVDGVYASLGGICIADQWLARSPTTGLPYRDTAVRVEGPAIADLEHAFATVWNRSGTPLPLAERPSIDQIGPIGDEAARVIIQEPGKLRILRLLELLTAGVQERLWIADAYFLSGMQLTQALLAAAQDGVDVRLLLPATNDLPLVGALSRMGYRQLLESGVRIWEYSGLMMHAKTTVADGWWSRVGSTNLNITGLLTNWEIDLVVEDRRFGALMEGMFEEDMDNAREIRLRRTRRRPRLQAERQISQAERKVQRKSPGSGSRAVAAVSRASNVALRGSTTSLERHERTVVGAVSAALLSLSVLLARFPRLFAWPAALVGGILGAIGMLRAIRSPRDETQPDW